jgi:excisionase family DNA binding protein
VSAVVEAVRLYSVIEAAGMLGVSRQWVYDRINDRSLAVVELGDKRPKQRIRADDLQSFIDARTHNLAGVA